MKIILDEKSIAEKILNTGEIYNDFNTTTRLLIKYWNAEGNNTNEIRSKLINFISENIKDINLARKEKQIDSNIKYWTDKNYPLIKIDKIDITTSELEFITGINNLIQEKIAFVLLVYCKIFNQINPNNNNWVNTDMKEVFRDAKVSGNNDRKYGYLHKLKEYGAIFRGVKVDGDGYRIEFVDDESDVEITIDKDDFDEFILEYLKWRGDDIGRCEICNKRIKITSNRGKYCNECWKEKEKEIRKEINKKYYSNNKEKWIKDYN